MIRYPRVNRPVFRGAAGVLLLALALSMVTPQCQGAYGPKKLRQATIRVLGHWVEITACPSCFVPGHANAITYRIYPDAGAPA